MAEQGGGALRVIRISELLLEAMGKTPARVIRLAASIAMATALVKAQVSVRSIPPAVLVESTGSVSLTAQVSGTLPGESTAVLWSLNAQPLDTTPRTTLNLVEAPQGAPLILKATSVFDPSKFAAVPVISLRKLELAEVNLPGAVAYHPSTGKIYVAALVSRGNTVDTNILEISPDGRESTLLTLQSDLVSKLIPYRSSTGTDYLLAPGFISGSIHAVNLSSRTARRVVTGLMTPVSGSFHPVSGDLYVAEENAGRISVVSRSALDSAILGTSSASSQPLPITIPQVSGVGFLVDHEAKRIFLLAPTTSGTLNRVGLEDNTLVVVSTGLSTSQELSILENPQLGFSFVLTASSANLYGQGRILALLPLGANQPFSPAYSMVTGLDVPTDLAFAPQGNSYSPQGGPAILVANPSRGTPGRGKVILWEIDSTIRSDFYTYNDRVQASLSLVAPAEGEVLVPGAPVEVRWKYSESNPLNPGSAPFPDPAQILVSTDGGNSFVPAGPLYLPSGPQGNEYRQTWQVPADLAGATIRIRIGTRELDGRAGSASSGWALPVLPKAEANPIALFLDPNFVILGKDAKVNVHGLNLQAATRVSLGEEVSLGSLTRISSSRLQTDLSTGPFARTGGREVLVCNEAGKCQATGEAFFVLSSEAPRMSTLEPKSGSPGTTVVITGANFSGVSANNQVRFGNLVAVVSQAEPSRLVVEVPFGMNQGRLSVSVETNGISSNKADFFLVPAGFSSPLINQDGIVHGASFSPGTSPLAAGSIASLFGANLAPSIASAASLPLPRDLLNTTVVIGGVPAPLFFAAPNQINAQLPEEIAGLGSVPVTVVSRGIGGNTTLLDGVSQSPGIFSVDSSGKGPGAVLNQDGRPNSSTNPERIGNTLQVFATGLGEVSSPVATGMAALNEPLSLSVHPARATIDGITAPVTFSGRSPGFVGLDQVNVVIPSGVTTGRPVTLVITAGSNRSNAVSVVVSQ